MKKFVTILITITMVIGCCALFTGFTYAPDTQKDVAHRIAELARSLGLPEDDPIVVRAKELWLEADEQFCSDRDIIATVVYNEAWFGCSMRHRELVAAVVWNRVKHETLFPDTVYEVVIAPGQYHPKYADPTSYYSRRARENEEAWKICQDIATRAMLGQIECPDNVVFQSEFKNLGSGLYEEHRTSYSVTYFRYA